MHKAVNRIVPVKQLLRVMGWLREADFSSANVDLISGLPLLLRSASARTRDWCSSCALIATPYSPLPTCRSNCHCNAKLPPPI